MIQTLRTIMAVPGTLIGWVLLVAIRAYQWILAAVLGNVIGVRLRPLFRLADA